MIVKFKIFNTILFIAILLVACNEDVNKDIGAKEVIEEDDNYDGIKDLFEFVPSTSSGVLFENSIRDSLQLLCFSYEYAFNGGGVAVGDINNDGLQDLFFTGTLVPNRLYLNLGNWKFRDISANAKVNNDLGTNIGTSMIDINNDGLLDIYVCKSGTLNNPEARRNCLYINQGDLTFKEEAKNYGLDDPSYSTQAYFADFDLDGDLDVYFVNHPINWGQESNLNLQVNTEGNITVIQDTQRLYITDRYMVNNNGKFVDKTYDSEVDNAAFGLSAIVNDFNGDNYPDLYICNDYSKPDRLMINQKGKGFKDEIHEYFDNISASSMGSELMDINNDGEMDLFVNDMMHENVNIIKQQQSYLNYDLALVGRTYGYHDQFKYNSMQVKMEDGKYSNISFMTDTDKTGWSWSVLSADYDHNGFSDLFIVNGYLKDVTNMDYSKFRLDSLRRTSRGKPVGELYDIWTKLVDSLYTPNYFFANNGNYNIVNASKAWNSGKPSFSNGAAYADLDNDGDLDLIVNNINDPAFLMKNTLVEQTNARSLRLKLSSKASNYGSTLVAMYDDGSKVTQYYYPIKGFVSSVEQFVHFAIPEGKNIATVGIKWVDGKEELFELKGFVGTQTIEKGKGVKWSLDKTSQKKAFTSTEFPFAHKENEYIDFKREPLLHFKNSVEGPCLVVGDFNGDKKEDVIAGGAFLQPTQLFIQNSAGFKLHNSAGFAGSEKFEDVDMAIGDIDNDGDIDIAVLQGGYQWDNGSDQYGVKVYLNDGKANFTLLNPIGSRKINANAIGLLDIDGDKDLDIVVGAGAIPGSYPNSEKSYLLINDGNQFSDKSDLLPNNGDLGLIKDIAIADMNADGKDDIIMAGEWREVSILIQDNGKFINQSDKLGLSEQLGLWQKLETHDVDGDGDLDIVAGNLGLNSFFKASKTKPTCIYAYDFDNNGENDPIMCTFFGDKSYPVHSRDEILDQMTTFRKKYLRYASFANDDIVDMFGKDKVDKAKVYRAYTFASTIFINNGDAFDVVEMPLEAQMSMVRGIDFIDLNQDGQDEIIIGGNFWDTDYDFGKYDASVGTVLTRQEDGKFKALPNTGFIANKNVRAIKCIDDNKVLVANNDGESQLFTLVK